MIRDMSFATKTNGRDYVSKSSPNANKIAPMNYRNSLTNAQYTNSSNGESYIYDEKNQQSSNSPKAITESHGVSQHNPNNYPYKNSNHRPKQYHTTRNYNDKHNNYYNQRSDSPDNVIIPEIDHLRDFIKQQTERFQVELSHHESQKSDCPSPVVHQYNEQSTYKYNKAYGSLGRQGNGLPASHSLGSIANSNNQPVTTLTVSPSCVDSSNRHPDARVNQNSFEVIKNNNNGFNYNKQNSGKPVASTTLTRNLSHEEAFNKSPSSASIKNRNDSPNNVNKSQNNKAQFPSPTGTSGVRQDPKKCYNRAKPYSASGGSNASPVAMHQLNQNNSMNDTRKFDAGQHSNTARAYTSALVRNGSMNGANGSKSANTQPRRRQDCDVLTVGGAGEMSDSGAVCSGHRAVVSVMSDSGSRRLMSYSGSSGTATDSQEVLSAATGTASVDTPVSTTNDKFFTPPDPPASPCSSPETHTMASAPVAAHRKTQRAPNNGPE